MQTPLDKELKWLQNEIKKDQLEIERNKNQLIKEIKSLNKSEMFQKSKPKKISVFKKLLIILGYGKKR